MKTQKITYEQNQINVFYCEYNFMVTAMLEFYILHIKNTEKNSK